MKKHSKIIAPERDQIAWWLAYRVTIREMARRLGRSMQGTQLPDILEVFTAHITKVFGLTLEFMTVVVSKRTLFEIYSGSLLIEQRSRWLAGLIYPTMRIISLSIIVLPSTVSPLRVPPLD
jgi:hypothetical protein